MGVECELDEGGRLLGGRRGEVALGVHSGLEVGGAKRGHGRTLQLGGTTVKRRRAGGR